MEGSRRPKNMWIRWIWIRIRIRNTAKKNRNTIPVISVPDPGHFEMDPDPWMRTLDYGSRSGYLLFSSVALRMPTKNKFFPQVFLLMTYCRYN
jgi:hypothetical protein